MMNDFTLLSYPRSGVHLLKDLLYQHDVSHPEQVYHHNDDLPDTNNVVAIVRDPIYAIGSHFAMWYHYNDSSGVDKNAKVYGLTTVYININSWILENAKHVILYDNLINNMSGTMRSLLERLNRPYKRVDYILDRVKSEPEANHMVSSKSSKYYEEGLKLASECSLIDEAREVYQKAQMAAISDRAGRIYWKT